MIGIVNDTISYRASRFLRHHGPAAMLRLRMTRTRLFEINVNLGILSPYVNTKHEEIEDAPRAFTSADITGI